MIRKATNEKVQEVSHMICDLEKKIAEEEMNYKDADSIKDKIFNLKRKLGLFREVLRTYSPSSFNYRHSC